MDFSFDIVFSRPIDDFFTSVAYEFGSSNTLTRVSFFPGENRRTVSGTMKLSKVKDRRVYLLFPLGLSLVDSEETAAVP